jgi:hypothetical protein
MRFFCRCGLFGLFLVDYGAVGVFLCGGNVFCAGGGIFCGGRG